MTDLNGYMILLNPGNVVSVIDKYKNRIVLRVDISIAAEHDKDTLGYERTIAQLKTE